MIVGIHMVLISEFTISKYDVQPLIKMSLIHYGKCLLVFIWLHYYWISLYQSLCMQFHLSVQYDMHSCVRCNIAFFCLCMHSLYHPWPSTEKGSGGLPRVHRLLWSEGARRTPVGSSPAVRTPEGTSRA